MPIGPLRQSVKFRDDGFGYERSEYPVNLYIHVTEGTMNAGPTFYGFRSSEERQFFRELMECEGMGGGRSLAVISKTDYTDIQQIIQTGDRDAFKKLPGIGPKTGTRLKKAGVGFNKLKGETLSFQDLARANCVFIRVHGANWPSGKCMADITAGIPKPSDGGYIATC
jgi:hypothetical protein